MSNRWKRMLAWMLALTMIFSSNAVSVLATEAMTAEEPQIFLQEEGNEILESDTEEAEPAAQADEMAQAGGDEALPSADMEESLTTEDIEQFAEESENGIAALADEQALRGEGTEDHPYLIASEAELALVAQMGETAALIGYFNLEADITLTGTWTPIGVNSSYAFRGIFDGQGHTVRGLVISEGTGLMGLFGRNAGTVKNLTVDGSVAGSGIGGILVAENTGKIENCHVSGSVESGGTHGGLVGRNLSGGTIESCTADVNVTGKGSSGGFAGENNASVIRYSGAIGEVSGSTGSSGGFVGYHAGGGARIENCYAQGKVAGSGNTGGFAGHNETNAVTQYCYAAGMVNGNAGSGLEGAEGIYSYTSGRVVRFCYYNGANTGRRIGIPASAAQLKSAATYSGWDFEHVWKETENGYPVIQLRGEAAEVEIDGDGSEENPYVITNEAQLQALSADRLPVTAKAYYRLGADIELRSINWTPIGGNGIGAFAGVFDGDGHTVSGLKISGKSDSYAGLFGQNAGTIKNVRAKGSISAEGYAGILAAENTGRIENCHASGSVESSGTHGGLVGRNVSGGTIENCTADVKVAGSGTSGGFAGENSSSVIRCSGAIGEVSGSTGSSGGFVGYHAGGGARIENCYAQGKVTGSGNTGGFAGHNETNAVTQYCYAAGMVNGNAGSGLEGAEGIYSYTSGRVVRFCYYNSANTGRRIGIPVSAAQLKSAATYSGWDFEHIWKETENGYPVIQLRGEAAEIEIDGDGSEESPYIIMNEAHLQKLSEDKLPITTKTYYRLGADIELGSVNWTPIGGNGVGAFAGVFDGDGHTVSGLRISGKSDSYAGLFGRNAGTIKNVRAKGSISAEGCAGTLVGENTGRIENCHVSGSVQSSGTHGGLVGRNVSGGKITECTSNAKITGSGLSGGLVGENNASVIRYSGASGEVSGSTGSSGGFVGYHAGGGARIENCYAQGKVTGSGNTGGFAGHNETNAVTQYCYAAGMVNGNAGSGLEGAEGIYSYTSGRVVRFCYYNSANTGRRIGIPASAAQLKSAATYSGWDFEHVWKETENGYPVIQLRGEAAEVEIDGDGSEENPYVITNEAQLQALSADRLPVTAKAYYRLGADIELRSINWTPIGGNGIGAFAGVFDGDGHTVSGLKISGKSDSYAGLFGQNAGTIKNVRAKGSISAEGYAGTLVGENTGRIENCHVSGSVQSSGTHGGLVGRNVSGGTIENCTADVKVAGSGTSGGFAGENSSSVIRCSGAIGEVSGSTGSSGGFVGYHAGGGARIENCYAQGKVAGSGNTGGFAGHNETNAVTQYCYAAGMVNGNAGSGLEGAEGIYSYTSGRVVRFCYYNGANTGRRIGIPASAAQLKSAATYSGWDFDHIWKETENGYPVIELRGEATEIEITGDGSEDAPYLITNEAQLQALTEGKLPLSGKNYYQLANDILLTSLNWTPIGGNGATPFQGIFDGQGYTISGLKISGRGEADTGLFGYTTGTIKNLHVSGVVEAMNDAGLLAGENHGMIQNCSVSGSISGSGTHGGLAGRNAEGGIIEQSQSDASVTGSGMAGGLVGENQAALHRCLSTGKVSGSNGYAGGLTGQNTNTIENCYAKGNVSGSTAGGLTGRNYYGTIKNSYAAGKANEGKGGGLCGNVYNGTITNSYYCSTTSFCTDTGKGEPLTRTQMKQSFNYVDWDYEKTWGVYETVNGGFPFLLFEMSSQITIEQDFWYEATETRKGYAAIDQDMVIYLKEGADKTVTYTLVYNEKNEVKTAEIPTAFDEAAGAYAGTFHIGENIQKITGLSALVTDTDGNENTVRFTGSFLYQMPLNVEGILEALLPNDVAASKEMSLKLKNSSGSTFFTKNVDGSTRYRIDGLPGGVYTAFLYADGQEYARKEDVIVVQGQTVTADFTDIPPIANVEAEFYADGQKVSDEGISLNFFEKTPGKSRILGKGTRLSYLSAGDAIGYSLALTKEAQKKYRNDIVVYERDLHAGLNVLRFELRAFHRTTAAIQVENSVSGNVVPGVEVSVSQKLNGVHSYQASVHTNAAGSADVPIVDEAATVTFSKKGFTTLQKTYTLQQLQEGIRASVHPLNGIIEFRLGYRESKLMADENEETKNLKPNSITLVRNSTGAQTKLNLKEWPMVYLDGSGWNENETFTAQIHTDACGDFEAEAQVNPFGNLFFEKTAVQKGALLILAEWEQGFTSGNHDFALFNANGDRIRFTSDKNKIVRMEELAAGTYRLAAADKLSGLSKYLDLEELTSNTALEGQYALEPVTIEDGLIAETDVQIPALAEGKKLIKEEESSFMSNMQTARIGDTINIRSHFAFDSIGVSQKTAELTVPEGTRLMTGSVTVDGQQQDVAVSGGKFQISTKGEELTVRYTVKVLAAVTVSELSFTGKAAYRYQNENRTELLGKIQIPLNEMTIVAPSQTNYTNLTVHGVAPKNSALEIYDDDVLIGQTTSNKYGAYRTEVELTARGKNTTHCLKAVAADKSGESETAEVRYGSNTATLMQFDIYCNAHEDTVYSIKDPTREIGNLTFTYNPAYPVTFAARFDDNQGVIAVSTLISCTNGKILDVEMFYNEVYDYWEGTYKINASDIPDGFEVSYLPISFSYDEAESPGFEFHGIEVASEKKEGNITARERKLTLKDAGRTEIMELIKAEENVPFVPDGTYETMEIDGSKVYYKMELANVEWNGTQYEALQYYIPVENGYTLYTRGYGFSGAKEARLGPNTNSSSVTEYVGQVKKAKKKSGGFSDEEREAIRELIDALEESDDAWLQYKAVEYDVTIDRDEMYEDTEDAVDMCYDVVDDDDADAGFFDKVVDWIIKPKAKELTEEEKKQIRKEREKEKKTLLEDMVTDKKVRKFIEDEMYEDDEEDDADTKKKKAKNRDERDKSKKKDKTAKVKTIVDPSGFVYETFEENRLEGVTAELYYENDWGDMEFWDAEEYNQINPQKTDSEGSYGWDVPEGFWQVVYSKEGYETTRSKKLEVPPPQLDVNIEMVSRNGAAIAQQSCNYNRLTLTFDKYLQKSSVDAGKFTITKDGKPYEVAVDIKNENVHTYNGVPVVKTIDLTLKSGSFEDGSYQVAAEKGLQTYAGVPSGAIESSFLSFTSGDEQTYTITIPDQITVTRGDTQLANGDTVYCNDRLQITAKPAEFEELGRLLVNGVPFVSGEYYTVANESVQIEASFTEMKKTYRIAFDSRGGSAVSALENIEEGTKAVKPADPVKEGSVFGGWYQDESCQTPWNFEQDIVASNRILYAKWTDIRYQLSLEPRTVSAFVGDTVSLTAKAESNDGKMPKLVWSSTNPAVAAVSQQGAVQALSAGKAEIRVMAEGRDSTMVSCPVTVSKKEQKIKGTDAFVKSISDGNFYLDTAIEEGDGTLSFRSSDERVAAVSKLGRILLKSAGTAEIRITASETAEYLAAEKTVTLTVQKGTQTFGGTTEYRVTEDDRDFALDIYLAEGDGTLSYESSNPQAASVTDTGIVHIGSEGSAVIRVTAAQTDAFAAAETEITVTVGAGTQLPDPPVKNRYRVTFDSRGGSAVASLRVEEGAKADKPSDPVKEHCTFGGWYRDEACSEPWSFETDAVSADMTLYAKWTDTGYQISLNRDTVSAYVGESVKLIAKAEADDGTVPNLAWSSSDKSVAVVSQQGEVRALSPGTADIRAAIDGKPSVSAACRITVFKKQQKISGTTAYTKKINDGNFYLDAALEEGDGNLAYHSGDETIAVVSQLGRVVLKRAGAVQIQASASETKEYEAAEKTITLTIQKGTQTFGGTAEYRVTEDSRDFALDLYLAEGDGTLSYESSNPQTADVNGTGIIHIGSEGRAVIRVTASETDAFEPASKEVAVIVGKGTQIPDPPVKETYQVTFDSRGGSAVSPPIRVEAGAKITKPADPKKAHSIFGGWYRDEACSQPWNFETDAVSANATLYAKWTDVEYRLALDSKTVTAFVGDAFELEVKAEASDGTTPELVWSSSDTAIASVSQNGRVRAIMAGEADITAAVEGKASSSVTCHLTVTKRKQQLTGTAAVTKSMDEDSFRLDVELTEGDGNISYRSLDETVAAISNTGRVTLKQPGKTELQVTASETKEYEAAEFTVALTVEKGTKPDEPDNPNPPQHCTKHEYKEETVQAPTCEDAGVVIYTCVREDHSYGKLLPKLGHDWSAWTVAREPDALQEGQQERVCSRCNKKETKSTEKLPAILELNASAIALKVKQSTTAVKITKLQTGDSVASWISSDPSTVKVTAGGKITARKLGSASVTVTLKSGLSKSVRVQVQKKPVEAKKVLLDAKKLALAPGQSHKLNFILNPITCAEKAKYKSSNKKVASVSSKGVIKAHKKGKAKITVTVGKKKAVCTVTVQ